jgi:hypothetical protein
MNLHRAGSCVRSIACIVICCVCGLARADDAYYRVPLNKLTLTDDTKLPSVTTQPSIPNWARLQSM